MRQVPIGASTRLAGWFDGGAVFASSVCLIHCLLVPVIVAMSPMLADTLDMGEAFHLWMVLVAAPISATALIQGFRHHGRKAAGCLGAGGLALLSMGALYAPSESMETLLTVAGSITLAVAHMRNWTLRNGAARKVLA